MQAALSIYNTSAYYANQPLLVKILHCTLQQRLGRALRPIKHVYYCHFVHLSVHWIAVPHSVRGHAQLQLPVPNMHTGTPNTHVFRCKPSITPQLASRFQWISRLRNSLDFPVQHMAVLQLFVIQYTFFTS